MWELIGNGTERMKVPGGWVIHRVDCQYDYMPTDFITNDQWKISTTMCFVPDPDHSWILEKKND